MNFPSVSLGVQFVEQDVADAMIAAECAQDWQTDQRKLISPSVSRPPVPKGAPSPSPPKQKRGRPRKKPVESTPPSEDLETEPSQADADEAPRYRRRDLRAEK